MTISDSERIVFFGDSLTDGGTVHAITSQILSVPFPLESAGYQRVFSNGPVYSQFLPALLGIASIENHAVGGARALGSRPISQLGDEDILAPLLLPGADPALLGFDINLGAQVARFVADEKADPFAGATTAVILIGLNDMKAFAGSDPSFPALQGLALIGRLGAATLGAAHRLADQGGVDEIVLYTFPDASFFPFSQGVGSGELKLAERLFDAHAAAMKNAAGALELAGVDTEVVDLGVLADEISADMQTFGFLRHGPVLFGTASDPMIGRDGSFFFPSNSAVVGLDPDQIVFYDIIHPTTALHGVLAAYSASVLEDRSYFLSDGDNVLLGSSGSDFVLARAGDDILTLRRGDDRIFAGPDDDRVYGDKGRDILAGGSGNDELYGGSGADVVAGNTGDDLLFGRPGPDILIDGLGADRAFGGPGDDVFFYTEAARIGGRTGVGVDRFFGEDGLDTLFLSVSEANRTAAATEIGRGGGPLGSFRFDTLNLSLEGIEAVVLLDRLDFGNAPVAPELQAALHEADLWGLV
jgi:phospholipase/lecithinase/hemolysin